MIDGETARQGEGLSLAGLGWGSLLTGFLPPGPGTSSVLRARPPSQGSGGGGCWGVPQANENPRGERWVISSLAICTLPWSFKNHSPQAGGTSDQRVENLGGTRIW